MITYSFLFDGALLRSDGASIPPDPNNADYQAYLAWVAAGNTATAYTPPTLTSAQQIALNEVAIQGALDATALTRGYSSIKSACAYAAPAAVVPSTSPNFAQCEKFRLEGNALQIWMAETWAQAYAYLATVQAGTNPLPTATQAVAMMPPFTWPD